MRRKVLVVDDSKINRLILMGIISDKYDVCEAENGEDALARLCAQPEAFSAVLLDLMMPIMDGYAVLAKMRADARLISIPVIVMTGSTEHETEVHALELGANDFIVKPYNPEIIRHRLSNTIRLRETAAIANAAIRDSLTGIYNRDGFFVRAKELVDEKPVGFYVLSSFDINYFKVINDLYGTERGDSVLRHVAHVFSEAVDSVGGISCRINADEFAALYPCEYMDSELIRCSHEAAINIEGFLQPLAISTGRYVIDDKSLSLSGMYDRAVLAKSTVKGRFDRTVAVFTPAMRESLLLEQEITNDMNFALADGQFRIWLQPQYNHASGALIGAEALVRWLHPKRGMVSPALFIPVFERNGFIYELDKFVWEQACMLLARWINEGTAYLPVSVNVSRYDILCEDFFEIITGLLEKYRLPVEALRIEVTESAFSDQSQTLIEIVKRLSDYGFTIEIDDFGSGYSSLNTLKDVPAHILKLDMRFWEGTDNSTRGGNILESIVRMAKWLDMPVIAEGVETLSQADYLKSIGCSYLQGYLYARPMPVEEYDELLEKSVVECKMGSLQSLDTLNNNTFWDPASMDTLIFNSYVGGACIIECTEQSAELLRANEKFARILSGSGVKLTVEDVLKLSWLKYLVGRDKTEMIRAIDSAIETNEESSCEIALAVLPPFSQAVHLRVNLRMIASSGERRLLYAMIDNLTAQRVSEAGERRASSQLRSIMDNVSSSVSAAVFNADGTVDMIFANSRFYSMLGYTKEEFDEQIGDALKLVVAEDLPIVYRGIDEVRTTGRSVTYEYRCRKKSGEIIYLRASVSRSNLAEIGDAMLFVVSDVSDLVAAEVDAKVNSQRYRAIMDNVEGGISAYTYDEAGNRVNLFVNDRYYEHLLYTPAQFAEEVESISERIHPDDRARVEKEMQKIGESSESASVEFRALRRDGSVIWIRNIVSIAHFAGLSAPVWLSISYDVTENKLAAERLRFLNDTAHELLSATDENLGIRNVLQKTVDFFGASRAYLVELESSGAEIFECFEVNTTGETEKIGFALWNDIPFSEMPFVRCCTETTRIIKFNTNDEALSDAERARFVAQSVHSVVAIPLRMNGRVTSYFGIDNISQNAAAVESLIPVGEYLLAMQTRSKLLSDIESNNAMLTTMMNDTPGAFKRYVICTDGSFKPDYVNDGYCELVGTSREEILSENNLTVEGSVHPDDRDAALSELAKMTQSGLVNRMDYRLRRSDGTYVGVHVFGRISISADGTRYLNLYYTALTEADRIDEQRRDLLDNLPCGAGIFEVLDDNIKTVYLNRSYIEMVGDGAALAGEPSLLSFVHPDDRARFAAEIRRGVESDTGGSCNIRLLCGYSVYRAFNVRGALVKSSGSTLIFATYTPLSDSELASSQVLPIALATMMQYTELCSFIKDRRGVYLSASGALAKLAGKTDASEIVGKNDYELFSSEIAERYLADDVRIIESGKPLLRYLEYVKRPDGSCLPVRTSKYPLIDSRGECFGIYGIGEITSNDK